MVSVMLGEEISGCSVARWIAFWVLNGPMGSLLDVLRPNG